MRFLFCQLLLCIPVLCFASSVEAETTDSIIGNNLLGVEITSSRTNIVGASSPLQVVTSETIGKLGIQTVSEAVRHFTGVTVKDYGGVGGIKTVSVRGFGAQHTAVSYDGVTLNDVQAGQIDIGRFALDNVSRISLELGLNSIFQPARNSASIAHLSIQTQAPNLQTKKQEGKVSIKTGSFGLFNPAISYAHRLSNKFSITANGSWERSDGQYPFFYENGIDSEMRKRRNTDASIFRTEVNLYGKLNDKEELTIKAYYFDSERGLPGSVIFHNEYSAERMWNQNFFSQASYQNKFSPQFTYKVIAKYDYDHAKYINPQASENLLNVFNQQEFYLSNMLLYNLNDKVSFSVAEDLSYTKLENDSIKPEELRNPIRKTSLTSFATKYEDDRLSIVANLIASYSVDELRGRPNDTYKRIAPSIAASYALLDSKSLRFRASYRDIFRIPTMSEVYYKRVGKPLKPEKVRQFNVGVIWSTRISNTVEYFNVTVDAFHANVKDKIIIIPSTSFASTSNAGKVRMNGVDLNMKANIVLPADMLLRIAGGYSYLRAIDVSLKGPKYNKEQIPYTPKHSGSMSLILENPWVNFGYTFIASDKRYMFTQNLDENEVKGYMDHTVSVNKQFKIGANNLSLQASLLNIFDKNYEIIKFYPMPGRSFSVSAQLSF